MTSSGVVFTRLVLGYLLALPFIAPWLASAIGGGQGYTFVLRMSSTTGGVLQLFYDIGSGHSEHFSVSVSQTASGAGTEHRLPLPPGRYRSFRIDPPAGGGLHTIERASVVREADASTVVNVPLMEMEAVRQVNVLERTPERLVLSVPTDSNDPILAWTPSAPITMMPPKLMMRIGAVIALLWIGGTLVAWAAAGLLRRARPARARLGERIAAFGASNPRAAIVVVAFLATALATYPVLFAGRSFVSPANGGSGMLYDRVPFSPGSDDFVIEDTRGSDIGAMMAQSLAHSLVQREALAMGELPLWNRYTALGRPLWGQGLSYILDPLHWLTFLGADPAPGWDLKFVAHRFVFALGVGLASFASTGSWLAAAIVAAAAPFAGAFSYRFNHPAIFSLTYAPWALLAWFLLAKATTPSAGARATILLTVSSGLLLVAPTPKEAAIALLCTAMAGGLTVLLSPGSSRLRGQRLTAAAVGGIAVVLMTAPHWLVFLDTMSRSAHAYESPSVVVGGILNTIGLWVSPIMPGMPAPGLHLFALMLVAAASSAPFRLWNDRPAFASIVVAALFLSFALGTLPTAWLTAVPLISRVGHLYDVLLMASLTPLLIVSATGARTLESASTSRSFVAMITTGVLGWWLVASMRELGPFELYEPWAAALLLPLAVAWPLCLLRARQRVEGATVAATATMIALLLPGGLHVETAAVDIDRLLLQPRPRPRLAQTSPAIDALHAATMTTTRTTGIGGTLSAGSSVLYRLEDIRGADPLEVPAYRELIDASGMHRQLYWLTSFTHVDVPRLSSVLDMLNVGFLIAPADAIPPGGGVLPMKGPDMVRAVQRRTPWPRAFFVDGINTYTTPADLVEQVGVRRAPFAAILDGDASAADATRGLPRSAGHAVPADEYVLSANTTSFRVRTDREGLAVLGETYLPHEFIATLNGQDVPYFRVNHVFKAVRIPGSGEWTIRFTYRPRRWGLALGAAALGALILIGLAVVAWRGRGHTLSPSRNEGVYP